MKRKWLRRLAIAAGVFVLFCAAALVVGRYWLVPYLVRREVAGAASAQWDGHLSLGAIDFHWSGPSYLRDIELRDKTGRTWLRAGSVKLTLSHWPGLHPALAAVDVDDLALKAYLTGGALQLPVKPSPPSSHPVPKSGPVDIPAVAIRDLSVGVADETSEISALDGLQIAVDRDGKSYRIDLKRTTSQPDEELLTSGTVAGDSGQADLSLVLKHAFVAKEGAAILAALKVPVATQADGTLDAKLDFRGRLADFSAFPAPGLTGTVALAGATVAGANGPLLTDLKGQVRFDGQAPPAVTAEWSAAFCEGQTQGTFGAKTQNGGTVKYLCKVDAKGIDFDGMMKTLGAGGQTRSGRLQATYALDWSTGGGGQGEPPVAHGYVFLEGAHMADVPLLTDLFRFSGLTQFDAVQATDVEATFAMKDSVITLDKARASNAVAAIDVEPGGQVDIGKHYLDLYTILAPVKQLHDTLASIPLVKLAVNLEDKLTRVHIQGDWNASPATLLHKEPLKDVSEGTLDFVRGAAATGGQAGKTLRSGFDKSFLP